MISYDQNRSLSQRTWRILQNIRTRAETIRRGCDPALERARAEAALARIDPGAPLPRLSEHALRAGVPPNERDEGA